MQVCVRTSDNVIVQSGTFLGPRAGCTLRDVDDATWTRISNALAQPNGGISLAADGTVQVLPVVVSPVLDGVRRQRVADAVTILNNAAVMTDQATRDAMARTINVQPVTIPIAQKAVASDITLVGGN